MFNGHSQKVTLAKTAGMSYNRSIFVKRDDYGLTSEVPIQRNDIKKKEKYSREKGKHIEVETLHVNG